MLIISKKIIAREKYDILIVKFRKFAHHYPPKTTHLTI